MNIQEALATVTNQLESETAALDAQVLLANTLKRSRTWVISHPETNLSAQELEYLNQAAERLRSGDPLPYVLGHWEFYGMDLEVNPGVLIPRPETELLVEHAISWLTSRPGRRKVIEIGTGSGCIAVAIARHVPGVSIIASDISAVALQVAKQNAHKHDLLEKIQFIRADLLSAFLKTPSHDQKFDMICSNPPYVPTRTLHTLPIYNHEPDLALDGGQAGLSVLKRLILEASAWLAEPGKMLIEIESSQAALVITAAFSKYRGRNINILKDLSGQDRLLSIEG